MCPKSPTHQRPTSCPNSPSAPTREDAGRRVQGSACKRSQKRALFSYKLRYFDAKLFLSPAVASCTREPAAKPFLGKAAALGGRRGFCRAGGRRRALPTERGNGEMLPRCRTERLSYFLIYLFFRFCTTLWLYGNSWERFLARSVFIKEQESCFLTDLPHRRNPKGRKKIITRETAKAGLPKHAFLSSLLLAKAANSRDKPRRPLPKGWGEGCGAPEPDPGQALLPGAASSAPSEPENEIWSMGKGPQSLSAIPATRLTFPNCLFAEVIIE